MVLKYFANNNNAIEGDLDNPWSQCIKMFLFIIIIISIAIIAYLIIPFSKTEKWCNGYSGWPGPIELGLDSDAALYGNPNHQYKFNLDSNTKYMTMKGYP